MVSYRSLDGLDLESIFSCIVADGGMMNVKISFCKHMRCKSVVYITLFTERKRQTEATIRNDVLFSIRRERYLMGKELRELKV